MGTSNICRRCGMRIRWAKTVNHRPIPLDLHADGGGNIELINGVAHVVGVSDNIADVRHRAHFETCKNEIARQQALLAEQRETPHEPEL